MNILVDYCIKLQRMHKAIVTSSQSQYECPSITLAENSLQLQPITAPQDKFVSNVCPGYFAAKLWVEAVQC